MMKPMRRLTILLLVVTLLTAPITAPAMEMSATRVTDASIAGDFLICRPLGFAATVIGTTLFVVSLPFSAMGDNVGQVADRLVVEPARFTFNRPLGRF